MDTRVTMTNYYTCNDTHAIINAAYDLLHECSTMECEDAWYYLERDAEAYNRIIDTYMYIDRSFTTFPVDVFMTRRAMRYAIACYWFVAER